MLAEDSRETWACEQILLPDFVVNKMTDLGNRLSLIGERILVSQFLFYFLLLGNVLHHAYGQFDLLAITFVCLADFTYPAQLTVSAPYAILFLPAVPAIVGIKIDLSNPLTILRVNQFNIVMA